MIVQLNHHSFAKFIDEGTKLVDFGAVWCPPCRMQEAILKELDEEWTDTIFIGKVDTDEEAELAEKYVIQGLPTLLLFKNGTLVHSFRGLQGKEAINMQLKLAIENK